MPASTTWLCPLCLLAFNGAVVLQMPAVTATVMLAVVLLLAPIYVNSATSLVQIDVHTFWSAVSILLGTLLGHFLVEVFNMSAFLITSDLWMERRVSQRTVLVMAALIGASLTWGLVPLEWLDWTMALLICLVTIVLSGFLFRTGRRLQVTVFSVVQMHCWWFVCTLALVLGMGIPEPLIPSAYVPTVICATVGALLSVMALANVTLPNVVARAPKLQHHNDILAAEAIDAMTPEQANKAWRWDL